MITRAFESESSFEKSPLVLIPVPWAATASYGLGADQAPLLIRKASEQLDFFSPLFKRSYNDKIHFLKEDAFISSLNSQTSSWVKKLRSSKKKSKKAFEIVNESCRTMIDWVYEQSLTVLSQKKIPALAGGDHSVSQGLIQAIGEKYKGDFGLLHLDAHADMRSEYEGFKYSHASVMFNVLNLEKAPKKIVQAAVRDFCKEEYDLIQKEDRVECFFDDWIYNETFKGRSWSDLCEAIISKLPHQVYVSLDVDALSWSYAPDTGTPVPGGLSFNQILYLLTELKRQNKKLIGFDVVETAGGFFPKPEFLKSSIAKNNTQKSAEAIDKLKKEKVKKARSSKIQDIKGELEPSLKEMLLQDPLLSHRLEWNGNVSARLLYFLSGLALSSFKKI